MGQRLDPEKMRDNRYRAGKSIESIAASLHRSTSTINRWEKGLHAPSSQALVALAAELGCRPDELITSREAANS